METTAALLCVLRALPQYSSRYLWQWVLTTAVGAVASCTSGNLQNLSEWVGVFFSKILTFRKSNIFCSCMTSGYYHSKIEKQSSIYQNQSANVIFYFWNSILFERELEKRLAFWNNDGVDFLKNVFQPTYQYFHNLPIDTLQYIQK